MPTEADMAPEATTLMQVEQQQVLEPVGRVAGRTIQDLTALLEDGSTFTGRITGLTFERVGDEIQASGRLIGSLDGQRINETFDGVALPILDENGDLIDLNGDGVCQILFLELGPIFLDVLGLVVEVPDPIVVEIRAEQGPGNLLGNLLCALVGILD